MASRYSKSDRPNRERAVRELSEKKKKISISQLYTNCDYFVSILYRFCILGITIISSQHLRVKGDAA